MQNDIKHSLLIGRQMPLLWLSGIIYSERIVVCNYLSYSLNASYQYLSANTHLLSYTRLCTRRSCPPRNDLHQCQLMSTNAHFSCESSLFVTPAQNSYRSFRVSYIGYKCLSLWPYTLLWFPAVPASTNRNSQTNHAKRGSE